MAKGTLNERIDVIMYENVAKNFNYTYVQNLERLGILRLDPTNTGRAWAYLDGTSSCKYNIGNHS